MPMPGSDRYLVSLVLDRTKPPKQLFNGLLSTVTEVHPAQQYGMVGTYGVDLRPEDVEHIRDQLLDMVKAPTMGLGLSEHEPMLNSQMQVDEWLKELPKLKDPGELGCIEEVPKAFTIRTGQTIRTQRYWKVGPTLDQDDFPASVGVALVHHLNAMPRRNSFDIAYAINVQEMARQLTGDVAPTLDSGLKVMRKLGHLNQYRYAGSYEALRTWLLYRGGATLGMDFYEGMLVPDVQGFVRPTGRRLGRIAVFVRGVSPWGSLKLQYPFGERWGHRGQAWLSQADIRWLMRTDEDLRAACWRATRNGNNGNNEPERKPERNDKEEA